MAKIIAIVNQKGGVAKTTTSASLASKLVMEGRKTLAIDGDPQCNLTDTYRAEVHDVATLYDVLVKDEPIKEAIQHTEAGDIIPCDPLLKNAEQLLTRIGRESILRVALEDIADDYEFIIVDTPPQTGVLQNNALTAANSIIIPLTAERYTFQGIADLNTSVNNVRMYTTNKDLKIEGLLFVRADSRRKLARETNEMLPAICEQLNTKCYNTRIREAEAVRQAQASRQTIYAYAAESKKPCPVAQDYADFVAEFLADNPRKE